MKAFHNVALVQMQIFPMRWNPIGYQQLTNGTTSAVYHYQRMTSQNTLIHIRNADTTSANVLHHNT